MADHIREGERPVHGVKSAVNFPWAKFPPPIGAYKAREYTVGGARWPADIEYIGFGFTAGLLPIFGLLPMPNIGCSPASNGPRWDGTQILLHANVMHFFGTFVFCAFFCTNRFVTHDWGRVGSFLRPDCIKP